MTKTLHVRSLQAKPLNARLGQVFAISSAKQDAVTSVLVVLKLSDGSTGYGECAPMRPFTDHTQADNLAAVAGIEEWMQAQPAARTLAISRGLKERLAGNAPCRAAIEMALLDALCRHWKLPMYEYFGGVSHTLETDYTISVGSVADAKKDTLNILKRGINKIKVKIGKDPELDLERVLAIAKTGGRDLVLDANQAYTPAMTLKLVKALKAKGVVPALLQQPVHKHDWDGLAEVKRNAAQTSWCARMSVQNPEDAARMVKADAAGAINIKLMKSGLFDAREIAVIAKAAGLQLMIGGMVETRLAMTAAAHLAAGLGGFRFVDLDTPYFFAKDPMKGPGLQPNGIYDLSTVPAGIGVVPLR